MPLKTPLRNGGILNTLEEEVRTITKRPNRVNNNPQVSSIALATDLGKEAT